MLSVQCFKIRPEPNLTCLTFVTRDSGDRTEHTLTRRRERERERERERGTRKFELTFRLICWIHNLEFESPRERQRRELRERIDKRLSLVSDTIANSRQTTSD